MSKIETILSRAMSDAAFVDALFTDAEKALADYGLSPEEFENLKNMSRAEFEALTPDNRKSFGIIMPD